LHTRAIISSRLENAKSFTVLNDNTSTAMRNNHLERSHASVAWSEANGRERILEELTKDTVRVDKLLIVYLNLE
jgi:hypothetical protein